MTAPKPAATPRTCTATWRGVSGSCFRRDFRRECPPPAELMGSWRHVFALMRKADDTCPLMFHLGATHSAPLRL